jgi:hypothetical protein
MRTFFRNGMARTSGILVVLAMLAILAQPIGITKYNREGGKIRLTTLGQRPEETGVTRSAGHFMDKVSAAAPALHRAVAKTYSFGSCSRGSSRRIDRACPGVRSINPRFSSMRIIWCTEGGVIWKCRWMSTSAGGWPLSFVYW